MKHIGEVCWEKQFSIKTRSNICQGFMRSLFHVNDVCPNVSYFFKGLVISIQYHIQFSTIFFDSVIQFLMEVISAAQAGF